MASLRAIAPGVLVRTSRVMQTNTTVVMTDGRALLIDPAWLPDELAVLAGELREREITVAEGFATHAHHDHVLWHPEFGDVPR
ncbi:MAG: Zn-dependent hydrolase, including glyoxylase, partial [Microbacterium sp.]|nr:Zn-dependent hydrolase, including glyoxylase [Microbacterium sp.]